MAERDIPDDVMQLVAAQLFEELSRSQFIVAKWRKEDVWIRGAVCTNPEWYQRFCAQHEAPRKRYPKPRTKIKKWWTLRTLDRIARGIQCRGHYADALREIIRAEAEFREVQPICTEANHACPVTKDSRDVADW